MNTVLTAPAGIQNNDVLLIFFQIGISPPPPPTPTPPPGFTVLSGFPVTRFESATNFEVDLFVWSKIASGESGNYTVTHSSASSDAWMAAVSGAFITSPFTPAPTTNTGFGSPSTAPGVTTTNDNALIIFYIGQWNIGAITFPGGTTPSFTTQLSGASNLLGIATGNLSPPGATGNKSATTANTLTQPWAAGLVVVR